MAKTLEQIRKEKAQIKQSITATDKALSRNQQSITAADKALARIQHRKDPGDRPKNPGAQLTRDSKSSRGKVAAGPSKSRIKTIRKPVNVRRKISA
jgi:septal ring factor EnvC (AmiA/AmiB activator)